MVHQDKCKEKLILPLEALDEELREDIKKCAKGCYQLRLVQGNACWLGNDLQGKAKTWANKYNVSRYRLMNRIVNVISHKYVPILISNFADWRAHLVFEIK
jgi:hypothetical protein